MPIAKNPAGKKRPPISLRLPQEEEAFYRRKAGQHGVSVSVFLGKLLVAGVIAENVQDIEARLRALIASMGAQPSRDGMSDDMLLSLLTCEALLSVIVESTDVQLLYRAQEAARDKLQKLRGA